MKRICASIVVCAALLLCLQSTSEAKQIGMAGIHFQGGLPQGDFKDELNKDSYGLNGEFFFSPGKAPIGIGIVLGYGVYGEENRREPFSTTIPDVTVKVNTTNSIVLGHLALRAISKRGDFHPYAEGLVGLNYLFTETSISDASDGSQVASSTNQDDAVFSYGFGGGMMVRIASSGNDRRIHWMLDVGARYLLGGEAEYLKEGSIRRDNGKVEYDLSKSKTDLFTLRLGVTAAF